MFRVWDYDKDGFVNIRDFVHTFAYALRVVFLASFVVEHRKESSDVHLRQLRPEQRWYSFFYRCHQGVLSSEEVEKCVYCVLKTDPSVEPEMLDELTIQHTRNVGMKGRWNVGVRAAAHRHDSRNQSRRFGRMGAAR